MYNDNKTADMLFPAERDQHAYNMPSILHFLDY